MSRAIDYAVGQRFGRLVVVRSAGRDALGHVLIEFKCDCRKTTVNRGSNSRSGFVQSCGCLHKETAYKAGLLRRRHGHVEGYKPTPEYKAYQDAKTRCRNPNSDMWEHYGGRGIEFRFNSFEEWYRELGDKPEPKELYSVDRIDNDGHYEVGNVRWATDSQQQKNRRKLPKRN